MYNNVEQVSAIKDTLKLSAPSQTEVQAVTLTIFPTSVTILNDDNPDTISATLEAVTRTTRDEVGNNSSAYVDTNNIAHILDAWKR